MSWRIDPILRSLARRRPIFHSEADFQHALAWEIQRTYPRMMIRLERPFSRPKQRTPRHIDIVCIGQKSETWMELKYKTRKLSGGPIYLGPERFDLQDHRAVDHERTAFWEDVVRVEALCRESRNRTRRGFAIILTNNPALYEDTGSTVAKDRELRLVDGRTVHGPLWHAEQKRYGQHRGRFKINFRGTYRINWQNFSSIGRDRFGRFRYLALEANEGG